MDLINYTSILQTLVYSISYISSKTIYRMYKKQHLIGTENNKKERYQRKRVKLLLMGFPTFLCLIHSYKNLLNENQYDWRSMVEINWNSKFGMGILISLYMNILLYGGPIYQEIQNGTLIKKLSKIKFNKFRWDYFTKIVTTPMIDEFVFRGFINNSINSDFKNNHFFMIYSTFIYVLVGLILYESKDTLFQTKSLTIRFCKLLLMGIYLSYVLVQTETMTAVIINHGCLNFMGQPNINDLLRGNYTNEIRLKILRFYCLGIVTFLAFCALIL